jgi:hypothetical protein
VVSDLSDIFNHELFVWNFHCSPLLFFAQSSLTQYAQQLYAELNMLFEACYEVYGEQAINILACKWYRQHTCSCIWWESLTLAWIPWLQTWVNWTGGANKTSTYSIKMASVLKWSCPQDFSRTPTESDGSTLIASHTATTRAQRGFKAPPGWIFQLMAHDLFIPFSHLSTHGTWSVRPFFPL